MPEQQRLDLLSDVLGDEANNEIDHPFLIEVTTVVPPEATPALCAPTVSLALAMAMTAAMTVAATRFTSVHMPVIPSMIVAIVVAIVAMMLPTPKIVATTTFAVTRMAVWPKSGMMETLVVVQVTLDGVETVQDFFERGVIHVVLLGNDRC